MTYEESNVEKARIAVLIKADGAGSGTRWNEIAVSAMGGHPESISEVERLIGRTPSMQDCWILMGAAEDAMSGMERQGAYDQAAQRAEAIPSAVDHAQPYIANRLGTLRRGREMTQADLARACGIPISTLQKLENGTNRILGARVETALKLAEALGITVEALTGPRD